MGLVFVLANIWVTASRSLIPRGVEGEVTSMDRRLEKHPGEDDVYLVGWDQGALVQVDRPVFEQVRQGAIIRKDAWSSAMQVDGKSVQLQFSRDFFGMVALALPASVVLLVYSRWIAQRWPDRFSPDPEAIATLPAKKIDAQ
jgi:hypothetical protein